MSEKFTPHDQASDDNEFSGIDPESLKSVQDGLATEALRGTINGIKDIYETPDSNNDFELDGIDEDSLRDLEQQMLLTEASDLSEQFIREINKPEVLRRMAADMDLDITPLGRQDMLRQADEAEGKS